MRNGIILTIMMVLTMGAYTKVEAVSTHVLGAIKRTLSPSTGTVEAGYYAATSLPAVDVDLVAGNIADGVVIFGTTGTMTGGTGWAVPDTDQTTSHTTTFGEDHNYQPAATQMSYTDNGNGTITDNRTGLMWLRDANNYNGGASQNWEAALSGCEGFNFAGHSDWRLPNVKELFSIVRFEGVAPFIDPIFLNTQSNWYWTSTTFVPSTTSAMVVVFSGGFVGSHGKANAAFVRPVRAGP